MAEDNTQADKTTDSAAGATDGAGDAKAAAAAADTGKAADGAAAASGAADKGAQADAEKAKPATVANAEAGVGQKDSVAPSPFGDKWREALAGDDKALLERLQRFDGPRGVLDWALNAEKKLSQKQSGLKKPGKDATDEEIKAWREANDIPEAPDKYVLRLSNDRALGDDDKPVFDHFAKALHAAGASNAVMSAAGNAYLDLQEKEHSAILDEDQDYAATTARGLKEEWGPDDYKKTVAAIWGPEKKPGEIISRGLFADVPVDLRDDILGARMPNGRILGGDPAALKVLARLARDAAPDMFATFIPDGDQSGKSVDGEIAGLLNLMATNPQAYWSDPAKSKRLRELNEIKLQMQARGRAA